MRGVVQYQQDVFKALGRLWQETYQVYSSNTSTIVMSRVSQERRSGQKAAGWARVKELSIHHYPHRWVAFHLCLLDTTTSQPRFSGSHNLRIVWLSGHRLVHGPWDARLGLDDLRNLPMIFPWPLEIPLGMRGKERNSHQPRAWEHYSPEPILYISHNICTKYYHLWVIVE